MSELLGRSRWERRGEIDAPSDYRNGCGKERRVTLSCATIRVCRPRVRDWEERFESRVLPLFAKRTERIRGLIPGWIGTGSAWEPFTTIPRNNGST